MADIPIKFYKSVIRSQVFNPSNPPDYEEPAPIVNPPGAVPTTLFKLLGDVTDNSFVVKNGFVPVVVGENVLTLQDISSGYVTIGTAQTITGSKIFNNEVLELSANNPVFRIRSNSNTAGINFRKDSGEDAGGIEMSSPANKFSILTRVSNMDIEINPHGTGSVLFPDVPAGTGDTLMVNASNELVKGPGASVTPITSFTVTVNQLSATNVIYYQSCYYYSIGNLVFVFMEIGIENTGPAPASQLVIYATLPPKQSSIFGPSLLHILVANAGMTIEEANLFTAGVYYVSSPTFKIVLSQQNGLYPNFGPEGRVLLSGVYVK